MSAWRLLLHDMAEAGGGPLRTSQIPGWGVTSETAKGRFVLLQHGLIRPSAGRAHTITAKGWRVVEGVADLVEPKGHGKPGHLPRVYALVVRGATVPDAVIEDLLIASGLAPADRISADVIRAYSNRLVAVARGCELNTKEPA